ncbi:HNH endonuclease [Alcaligenes faecalis]|uniref:HNH endonuclease n=1 Tax=Alcaligenes faecalis TaxID=511 RepID=UPI000F0BC3AD|nr:HNH endonuclease [Alcaligenes faecalis]AYR19467.1 HNH endonuclease [Alcaligenes faecalis]
MAIKGKDIKILWGRSGNRCAICRTQLTQDAAAVSATFTLGEQAHIVGEKDNAARGESPLSPEERDSYHNLILLCPNHHTEIDKNEADWPVERLHLAKSKHELWVTETLSETIDHVKLAHQATVSAVIDSAVEYCDLEKWQAWTSHAFSPTQQWPKERPDAIWKFRQKVIAAIWPPGYDELKRATVSFSILIHLAAQKFLEHSEQSGHIYVADRFYKRPAFNPNYDEQFNEFEEWQSRCYKLLKDATKAANWFADVVRRDINPMFFATHGKFLIIEGPFMDLSFRTSLLEFTEEEKAALPAGIDKAV